jgi:hypothetical protein
LALFAGLLPYVGGALVVTLTRGIGWVALAGAAICIISTSAAYAMRKSSDPVRAKRRVMIDPALYGSEFAFTAVLIRYVFIRHGHVQIFNMKMGSPSILCVLGAISWFVMGLWTRSLKVGSSRPHPAPTYPWNRGKRGFEWQAGFFLAGLSFLRLQRSSLHGSNRPELVEVASL